MKNKIAAIILCMLMVSLAGALTVSKSAFGQSIVHVPTISFCNVAPNPCGVGQIVTVDFWLAVPIFDTEVAKNMTVYVTNPAGVKSSLGTFTTDTTGGTFTTYTPTSVGNYTFQMFYGGQPFTGFGYTNYYNDPSQSAPQTLVVTSEPRGGLPNTPLPTAYWETPVNSENIFNWAALNGGWMGYSSVTFANTGGYNATGNYNPFSAAPASAHILWTKPWCVGGAAGAPLGNTEQYSSFWTTSQYDPKYAPVIMNGVLYSTWYTTQTAASQGIIAVNLYNGQTEWVINTTTILRCGMELNFPTIDQYGIVGPYIFTQTGGGFFSSGPATWYMWDAMTGNLVASIINMPSLGFLGQDANGNIIGWQAAQNATINFFGPPTPATDLTVTIPHMSPGGPPMFGPIPTTKVVFPASKGPVLEFYNLTNAFIASGQMSAFGGLFDWNIAPNTVFDANYALVWAVSMNPVLNGQLVAGLGTALGSTLWAGNTLVFEQGSVSVSETTGYMVEAGYSATDGNLMWITNRTGGIYTPYTRLAYSAAANGIYVETNQNTFQMAAYSDTTGQQVWTSNLNVKMADGNSLNTYDAYGLVTLPDSLLNTMYVWGLGGDVWAVNMANGNILWTWSTYQINGPAGTESPYGVYPIWVFADHAMAGTGTNTILYLSEGHEYNPPLFHGALELALNATSGKLVWSNLGFDDTGTEVTDGVLTTFNAYDGQVYAYAQGPSKTTVSAPSVGVTTDTPVVISGTVTDVCAGASQEAVKANFPNGLPCVSDDSMKGLMEFAYEQQPLPTNLTGVPVTLYVLDSNHNYRQIGTTTSDGSGFYSFTWKPDITGDYTIYAVFAGTNGYYGSSAEAAVHAGAPPATQAPTASPASGLASNNTVMYGLIAVIIVIIIIGAVLAILVTRKRV
ncbi:MAG: PQQ-binding-like beta-propeller repeat protein [Candidatus Bathyarchaeia archaeon]